MNLIGKKVVIKNLLYDIVPANSKKEACVSLRNPETNFFIRHFEGRIIESENDGSEFFLLDSSFIPHEIENGFSLSCSNKGLEKHRICTVNGDTFVVNPDIAEHIFTIAEGDSVTEGLMFWGKNLIGQKVFLLGSAYTIVAANNGRKDCLSLKNSVTERFLRHKGGALHETGSDDGPEFFPADSSFVPVTCGQAFVLFCSNKGMEKVGICQAKGTFVVDANGPLHHFLPVSQEKVALSGKYVEFYGNLYLILPGNNGDSSCISLQNTDNFLFLRHREGSLEESSSLDEVTYFPMDSSFKPEKQGDGYILHCSNPTLTDHFLCVVDDINGIVSPDMDPYCFRPFTVNMDELSAHLNESLPEKDLFSAQDGLANSAFFAARALAQSSLFDCDYYYQCVPEIAKSIVDPILHYVRKGYCQGIVASPIPDHALYAEALLLLHMLAHGETYASLDEAGYFERGLGKSVGLNLKSARIEVVGEGKRDTNLSFAEEEGNLHFCSILTEKGIHSVGMFANSPNETTLRCNGAGTVTIAFGVAAEFGAQIKYTRISVYKNTSLITGLTKAVQATSEKPYVLQFQCGDNDIIKIQAEWTPCVPMAETLLSLLKSAVAERYSRNIASQLMP